MGCEVMYRWSLSGLVGIFLDLVIAFFLLCASAMAFIASKFLGFFGLCLPCPCNGLFGVTNPHQNYCLQAMLIDFPAQIVLNAQQSLKSKFPFDNIHERSIEERKGLCSSVSDAPQYRNIRSVREELSDNSVVKEGNFDVKGKGVVNQRSRGEIQRRRKAEVDYDIVSSVSSYDPPCDYGLGDHISPSCSINKGSYKLVEEDRIVDLDYGIDVHNSYYEHGSRITGTGLQDKIEFEEYEKEINVILTPREIELEQALKEERETCSALYLELDKERNAASSAADEAMAMILRLQEEKAFFEMEARQYQRIIEEKSAYDAEEMDILKEILVRREMEKLFLEKEVEAYRQMISLENDEVDISEAINEEQIVSGARLLPIGERSKSLDYESLKPKEIEKLQLRILEDMKPLRDISRHVSLPTPSTQVTPLERRSSSVSSGV